MFSGEQRLAFAPLRKARRPSRDIAASNTWADDDDRRDVDQAFVASASGQSGKVDLKTGAFMQIGLTPEVLSGLAFAGQEKIYGLNADSNLVTFNPQTTATTIVGNIGLPVATNGNATLSTSLGNRRLFALDPFNRLYSISPSTGQTDRFRTSTPVIA